MGVSIIPVGPDKRPLMSWQQYQTKRAPTEQIEEWWKKWPDANIALVTGEISGIMAVDCDTKGGIETFEKYLPESLETPIQSTPRGGRHYLFRHETGIRNNARILEGIDTRGEGGYILVSPSGNGNGRSYQWLDGLALGSVTPAPLPEAYKRILLESNAKPYGWSPAKDKGQTFFTQGRRDEDIFHAANCLTKGGAGEELTTEIIRILARNCSPSFSESEAEQKVKNALERAAKRERNITQELKDWIRDSGGGQFRLSDYQRETGITSKQEKHASVVACKRLVDTGVLERVGLRTGDYRIIDTSVAFMDFVNIKADQRVDLAMPLGIERKTIFFPKSVIIVAGVTGHGKTTFLLNIIKKNMHKFRCRYFASEMSPAAINFKLSKFDMPVNAWRMDVIPDTAWDYSNIQDKIFKDDLNFIDYLEPEGERSYLIHSVISKIIEKLDQGVVVIATQKKPGADLSAGGVYSAKAASLYLSMEWGKIFIFKNRFMEEDPQPTLNRHDFVIAPGQVIKGEGGWYNIKDRKRSDRLAQFERED